MARNIKSAFNGISVKLAISRTVIYSTMLTGIWHANNFGSAADSFRRLFILSSMNQMTYMDTLEYDISLFLTAISPPLKWYALSHARLSSSWLARAKTEAVKGINGHLDIAPSSCREAKVMSVKQC